MTPDQNDARQTRFRMVPARCSYTIDSLVSALETHSFQCDPLMLLIRLSIISIFQRKRKEEEEEKLHILCSAGVACPLEDL